ncbi:Putative epoxide hydrolase [Leucoagaricus sp. SymC.cos]|nr:Putative epoxide hydrolase [Leucoagaricus sp. SymC.cos]
MPAKTPFKIAVLDEELALLKMKLDLTRLLNEIDGAGRDYGTSLKEIRRLAVYWKDGYDGREHEAQLNIELPQFTRKSLVPSAIPLLFIHGWPGSFLEVRRILPMLVEESAEHPSFHVVAINLPAFGFSQAPSKKGFAISQYVETSHKLMLALGYKEYVTQGGDWGTFQIARFMASAYGPKHNKAWHTNCPLPTTPLAHPFKRPLLFMQHMVTRLSPAEKTGLEMMQWLAKEGQGYFKVQATQPQSLGYISIYWFSRPGPAASVRIYHEFAKAGTAMDGSGPPIKIPTGYSYFPKELVCTLISWFKAKHLVFESEHEADGHFAAYECPEALVGDLRSMFGKNEPAFSVVEAHSGFRE